MPSKKAVSKEDKKKSLQEGIGEARKCLDLPEFKKYREKYERVKEAVVNKLIEYKNPDPVQYAFHVSKMVNDLRALGTLLAEVKKEAREK